MRLRFTIHDLFWLVIVVALAVGWWLDHRHWATQIDSQNSIVQFNEAGKAPSLTHPDYQQVEQTVRPITNAESVIAVYYEDWGLCSSGHPQLILAVWPDGQIVWSNDRLRGGPPYCASQLARTRITELFSRFENEGVFADNDLNRANFPADYEFVTIFIKHGDKHVMMQSCHELVEDSGTAVSDDGGVELLNNQQRLTVLKKAPAEYLYFRFVWNEVREKLWRLIPKDHKPINGTIVMNARQMSWQE